MQDSGLYIKEVLSLGDDQGDMETCLRGCQLLRKEGQAPMCGGLGVKPRSAARTVAISSVGE